MRRSNVEVCKMCGGRKEVVQCVKECVVGGGSGVVWRGVARVGT